MCDDKSHRCPVNEELDGKKVAEMIGAQPEQARNLMPSLPGDRVIVPVEMASGEGSYAAMADTAYGQRSPSKWAELRTKTLVDMKSKEDRNSRVVTRGISVEEDSSLTAAGEVIVLLLPLLGCTSTEGVCKRRPSARAFCRSSSVTV